MPEITRRDGHSRDHLLRCCRADHYVKLSLWPTDGETYLSVLDCYQGEAITSRVKAAVSMLFKGRAAFTEVLLSGDDLAELRRLCDEAAA